MRIYIVSTNPSTTILTESATFSLEKYGICGPWADDETESKKATIATYKYKNEHNKEPKLKQLYIIIIVSKNETGNEQYLGIEHN